ncbi:hypothetical protein ACFVVU_27270 [Kitasatospora sp. NPDC057965]|uniref:hypothetical protein n=1 Tax=Kitasatospora sp. NPDC057965 TaxID=3346291 RepID=UPI0036D9D1A7
MDLTEGRRERGTGRGSAGRDSARRDNTGRDSTGRGTAGRIEVEIGELVLDGFAGIDHDRLTTAFRSELARLVAARGVPLAAGGDRALDRLAGLPPLPAGVCARRLGEALARAVHSGLSGGGRPMGRGRP